ncbi:MAG: YihY/virulence factor BrkB family protein [Dehalococcoidia bacterium]
MFLVRLVITIAYGVNIFLTRNCHYIAAAIAFYTLFSFFPLVLVVTFFLQGITGENVDELNLAKGIAGVVPVSTGFLVQTVEGVAGSRAVTGSVGLIGLIWASTSAFTAIRKGINTAWGVQKPRAFLSERLLDFGLAIGGGLVLMVLLYVSPVISLISELNPEFLNRTEFVSAVWLVTQKLILPVISFLAFLLLYKVLPNSLVSWRDVWLGALITSLVFDLVNWTFVSYVTNFPVYDLIYGPIGAVLALLAWVYISATILLFGAMVTSFYVSKGKGLNDLNRLKMHFREISSVSVQDFPIKITDGLSGK